ncbi:nitrogenase component 1 [Sporosalibacterium faouarense]|uniref:nitrogenase component 1 n=1 Tax=Sporosalibacterium faouarense TaxID=516123 RepID=UPI00192AFFF6|nr:nitrogenase component 1 [Sporosalibacterium faouarense]
MKMGLYKYTPEPSGRMGLLWTLGTIDEAAILEFGSMGHMIYGERFLKQTGIINRSKLFSTHIDEKDIALGITKRIDNAIAKIVEDKKIKAIFLLPSSIPETIGVDLDAICEELQAKYKDLKILSFRRGGFHDKLNHGIEEAIFKLAKNIALPIKKTEKKSFNIIGSCCDLSRYRSDVREIKRMLKGAFDINPICTLSSEASISDIEKMGSTHINIVIRREGIKAGEELADRFNTPYIYCRPYGYNETEKWLKEISKIIDIPINKEFLQNELNEGKYGYNYCKQIVSFRPLKGPITLSGHIDVVEGIKKFACDDIGMKIKHISCDSKAYETDKIPYWGEKEIMNNISRDLDGIIMAQPMLLKRLGRLCNTSISRDIYSRSFNLYESPFIGFRGAIKLCSMWIEELF